MRTQAASMRTVDRLVEALARMYVNGTGENHIVSNNNENKKGTS